MVWCGSNNRYQKDMCLEEIGLRAQNMIAILGSIIEIAVGGTCMSTRIFTSLIYKTFL